MPEVVKKLHLKPTSKYVSSLGTQRREHYEQVMILDDSESEQEFILGVTHIDAFHDPDQRELYDRLNSGETVTVGIVIMEDDS